MSKIIVWSVVCGLCFGASRADKVAQATAKRLDADATKAEKAGDLLRARDAFIESERTWPTKEAKNGIERVNKLAKPKANAMLRTAMEAYERLDLRKAEEILENAAQLSPGNSAVKFDLALVKYRQGKRDEAVELLESYAVSMQDARRRTQARHLQVNVLLGKEISVPAVAAAKITEINNQTQDLRDQENGDTEDFDALCRDSERLSETVPANASLAFNLGRCAERAEKFDAAIKNFTNYVQLAPQALDRAEVESRMRLWEHMASLGGEQGETVRHLHALALRHLELRRYDKAMQDFEQADQTVPGVVDTKLRMLILASAQGKVEQAILYAKQAKAADKTGAFRDELELALEELPRRKAEYDRLIAEANLAIGDLLRRPMIEDKAVSTGYAAAELQRISELVAAAAAQQPIAPEVNLLKTFICSQVNDFAGLRRSFDALAATGTPLSLYGYTWNKRNTRPARYGKLEFERDTVRFAIISTVKGQRVKASASPAGMDGLGNLGSPEGLRSGQYDGFSSSINAVKKMETRESFLYLELNDHTIKERKLLIQPLHLCFKTASEGPGARQYANNYTRAVALYSGFDNVKLGKESLTTREKIRLGMQIATVGFQAYAVMTNPFGAWELYESARKLTRNLQHSVQRAPRLGVEQQALLEGLPLKIIATEAVPLSFLTEAGGF